MSATQCPIYIEPRIGLAVRIAQGLDPQAGVLGWIVDVEKHTARVEFGGGVITRWFLWEDLLDERIVRTESVIEAGRAFSLAHTVNLFATLREQIDRLDWLEQETCRRQRRVSGC